uniref:SCAN box domain-containing protein n=1 Tax=Esox lucius TaxID=8010 RepID=A0A6Q2Y1P7_ESOLU
MDKEAAAEYTGLKREILACFHINPRERAHRFHDWTYEEGEPPWGQLYHLIRLVRGWLDPAKSTADLLEMIVIYKCLRELPVTMLKVIGHHNTITVDALPRHGREGPLTWKGFESLEEDGMFGR